MAMSWTDRYHQIQVIGLLVLLAIVPVTVLILALTGGINRIVKRLKRKKGR